jgi:D-alanyl-D-alanine carboxypeptidase
MDMSGEKMASRTSVFTALAFAGGLICSPLSPAMAAGAEAGPPASDPVASETASADAVMAKFPDFSGAVVVVRDGRPVFGRAFGEASRELAVANSLSTKFRIGSMTKPFTAIAVLQLAEVGKISLDDPVAKYDPAAPASWSGITLRHLLTHTSGIPNYTDQPDFLASMRNPLTPKQIVDLVRDKPLVFTPGSSYAYNNTGYVILGLVVQKASGLTYEQYVQRNIFEALGMKDSGYDYAGTILSNRAAGYVRGPAGYANASYIDMTLPYAAGALYSTADDLVIWEQAMAAGKLLSPASYQVMWADQGYGYGYGWFVDRQLGHRRVKHGGDVSGFSSLITRFPDDKVSLIVLSNVAYGPRDAIGDEMAVVYLHLPERGATVGGEAAVLKLIADGKRGEPDYTKMSPSFAVMNRAQVAGVQSFFNSLGEVRAVTLVRATPQGWDTYRVDGTDASVEVDVILGANGVIESANVRPVPRAP